MYIGMLHLHRTLATLLIVCSLLTFIFSFLASSEKKKLLAFAKTLATRVESPLIGINALLGFYLWWKTALPLSTWWVWLGVVVVVLYSRIISRHIKPAMNKSLEGSKTSWSWPAALNLLMLVVTYGIMEMRGV